MKNKRKIVKTLLAVCMAAALVLPSFPTKAANYSGSGTKASPFLVTSAEQLQGMRDNLSAHYKLANTIDLSGVDFKPIGRLDAPFTGTFTCELNADKTPKFVIKNLQMTIADTPYAAENKNKWEGGLFGATSGASITGIYVLDAKVTNNNFGGNTGAVLYGDYKPGMNEMPTGILIGSAVKTTIMNCGTTGAISGKASHCGGLVGIADGCSIKNCYSAASVITEGYWNVGGLIGSSKASNVISCFSTGNVKGGQTSVSSFIGDASNGGSIVDCYTTGNAAGVKEDSTNFTTLRSAGGLTITNCYTTGAISVQVKKNTEGQCNITNCYTLSGKTSDMTGFTEADAGTIRAKLSGGNWDTSGSTPTLVNIGIVADAGTYQPGAVDTGSAQSGTQGSQTSQGGTQSSQTVQSGNSEEELIQKCTDLITALPNPAEENAITLKNKDAVKEAWTIYNQLSMGTQEAFDADLTAKLLQARTALSILMAAEIVDAVSQLPDVDGLEAEDVETILSLWNDWEFLDDEIKKEIDESYVKKLEEAHEWALENEGSTQTNVTFEEQGFTKWQKIIIGICIGFVVLAVAFNVFSGVMLFKKARRKKQEREAY